MNDIPTLHLVFGILFFLTAAVGLAGAGLSQKGPSYWPATRLLFLLIGGQSVFWLAMGAAQAFYGDDPLAVLIALQARLVAQLLVFLGMTYCLGLVLVQNRWGRRATVDLSGTAHRPSPDEVRRQMDETVRVAMETGAVPVVVTRRRVKRLTPKTQT